MEENKSFCVMRFETSGFKKDPEWLRLAGNLGSAKIELINYYNEMVDFHFIQSPDDPHVLVFDDADIGTSEKYKRLVDAYNNARHEAIAYLNRQVSFRFEPYSGE